MPVKKYKPRIGGQMETTPEVDEMMQKIGNLTGCAVLLLPPEATQLFRDRAVQYGLDPAETFEKIMDGVLAALEAGTDGVFIQFKPLEEENEGTPTTVH